MRKRGRFNIYRLISKSKLIPLNRLMEWYPPFLLMGVRIPRMSKDYQALEAVIPLRWYTRNLHGTMFGGLICSATDPLPALLCSRLLPELDVWTKSHSVEFLKPAKSDLSLTLQIPDGFVEGIRQEVAEHGKSTYLFTFELFDQDQHVIARVKNLLAFRPPRKLRKKLPLPTR